MYPSKSFLSKDVNSIRQAVCEGTVTRLDRQEQLQQRPVWTGNSGTAVRNTTAQLTVELSKPLTR